MSHWPVTLARMPAVQRGGRLIALLSVLHAAAPGQTQMRETTALAAQALSLAGDISKCAADEFAAARTGAGTSPPASGCAQTMLRPLRQFRAQVDLFAKNNPQPGAVWLRDAGRLDNAVDDVSKTPTVTSLMAANAQLQALAGSLPKNIVPPARPSGPTPPTPAPATAANPRPEVKSASAAPRVSDAPVVTEDAGFSFTPTGGIELVDWDTENPRIRLNFDIQRKDKRAFGGLRADRIEANAEGKPVASPDGPKPEVIPIEIKPGDLTPKGADASSVIIAIDVSGSMQEGAAGKNGKRLDKLAAAKSAMTDFLSRLNAEDQVEVIAFDAQPRTIFRLSADKAAARSAIDSLAISYPDGNFTALYEAMETGVRRARDLKVRNVLLLTDGMEDTVAFRGLSDAGKNAFKTASEKKISDLAREYGDVHIFTVGIGDREAKGDAFVDCDTLDHISKATNGGTCNYISVSGLASTEQSSSAALFSQLSGILRDIGRKFHFAYTLDLHPEKATLRKDGIEHRVNVAFRFDEGRLAVQIPYTWDSTGPHVHSDRVVGVFQPFYPLTTVPRRLLFVIYAFGLTTLALLALPHRVMLWAADVSERNHVRKAVVVLKSKSILIGKLCPREDRPESTRKRPFQEGDALIICPNPECGRVYHLDCWHENGDRCSAKACSTIAPLDAALIKAFGLSERQGDGY